MITPVPKYPLTPADLADIGNRFSYHKPTADQPARYTLLRDEAKKLATLIMENVPPSRERSLALTRLEESIMQANAGIARHEAPGPDPIPNIFEGRISPIPGT